MSDRKEKTRLDVEGSVSTIHDPLPSTKRAFEELEYPDGGLEAWLQVLGSFFLVMNTWGIINTYGVFQTYYQSPSSALQSHSNSDISWIGSFQAFLVLVMGSLTGPLFDIGYFYHLLYAGSFLAILGMMMTSICTEYWQVFLAQGVCVGIGAGLLLMPCNAIIPLYFSKYKARAQGIAASGSSLGGVIYPVVFHRLQPVLGFGWTIRVMGFLMLVTLAISCLVMKDRLAGQRGGERRKLLDLEAFKEAPFCLFAGMMFFAFAGAYIPFFYISEYALSIAPDQQNLAFYFIAIMNASSAFGRIIPNYFSDAVGCLNTLIPCVSAAAILAWAWIADKSIGGMVAFAILYGFSTGTMVSLPPPTVVSISPSLEKIGARLGMIFTIGGFGLLIGNPIAGVLLGDGSSWVGLQAFGASCVTCAALFVIATRISKAGTALHAKA